MRGGKHLHPVHVCTYGELPVTTSNSQTNIDHSATIYVKVEHSAAMRMGSQEHVTQRCTSCVPNLNGDFFVINDDIFGKKIRSNCVQKANLKRWKSQTVAQKKNGKKLE